MGRPRADGQPRRRLTERIGRTDREPARRAAPGGVDAAGLRAGERDSDRESGPTLPLFEVGGRTTRIAHAGRSRPARRAVYFHSPLHTLIPVPPIRPSNHGGSTPRRNAPAEFVGSCGSTIGKLNLYFHNRSCYVGAFCTTVPSSMTVEIPSTPTGIATQRRRTRPGADA